MHLTVCGARGSVPSPGAEMLRYGGNTSCLRLALSDGTQLILDAGTGIRHLPAQLGRDGDEIHILLTHLHLDHIQGLLFFSPLFESRSRVTIWGPAAPGVSLKSRIARYLSAPLTPVDVRELPCQLDFRNCPVSEWRIGSAQIRAEAVTHRGPTLGFRIEDNGASLCYLPDHEPALIGPIDELDTQWLSGYSLAHKADLLVHDCQYTDEEYPEHFGWGHSATSQTLQFAERCAADCTLLFHHDPRHSDVNLDASFADAQRRWLEMGHARHGLGIAAEGDELEVTCAASAERVSGSEHRSI
ncbi:MAG: MBL fold metallo-hydrolase [Solirubrobacteraceae bacterium]